MHRSHAGRGALALAVFGYVLGVRAEARAQPSADAGARASAPAEPSPQAGTAVSAAPIEHDGEKRTKKHKKKHREKKKKKRARRPPSRELSDGLHFGGGTRAGAGVAHGQRERPDDFAFIVAQGELEPSLRQGGLVLSLPLQVVHRETFGAQLHEVRGSAALQADYRVARALRLSGTAGLLGVRRPGWPDLYQPEAGGYHGTNRYSYWTRRAGLGLTVHPARRHWIRADYAYALADYATDPAFDPVARPNHLTPFDHDEHALDADYHYSTRGLRIGAGADAFARQSFFVFARDAHTGFTHAGPGGPPPNPLQALRGLAPRVELKLDLVPGRLELSLRYAHELQEDRYQGYYSYSGPNPRLELGVQPLAHLQLNAAAELWLRTYGEGSYRAGIGHPPLDRGDRRYDRKLQASLGAELALSSPLALTFDARYLRRDTNFPDYQPGVFPASQRYAIDWDYDDFELAVGLRAHAHWF